MRFELTYIVERRDLMRLKRFTVIMAIIIFVAIAIGALLYVTDIIYIAENSDVNLKLIKFDSVQFDEDCAIAYDLLLNADIFAFGPVGYGGSIPDEIPALGKLMICKNAKDYFIQLEQEATIEGKLYALCGLYYLDYDNYNAYLEKYLNNSDEVQFQYDCIGIEIPVKDLIKFDGAIQLKGINDTITKWVKRTHQNEGGMDFYGGGIPYGVLYYTGLGVYKYDTYGIKIFGFEFEF